MINLDEKKLILLTPKTGTVSFESLFKEEFCGYMPYKRLNPFTKPHMYIEEAIDAYMIRDIENWEIYQTVRNPMDRIPSAFLFSQKLKNRRWGAFPPKDEISFGEFMENLNKKYTSLSKEEIKNSKNRLYVPQVFWADTDKYNVQYIKLGEDNSEVYSKMGLPKDLELPFLNTNKKRTSEATDYEIFHTSRTKEIIRSLYEKDFVKINYE